MAQTLKIANFNALNIVETSKLDADSIIGATSLTLQYNDNFSANDYLYLGRLGSEAGELCVLASLSGSQGIVLSSPGTTKPHSRFDDITSLYGNKLKLYRAANVDGTLPADGSFSLVGSPIAIDFDQVQTTVNDPTGGDGYWYKATFFNSTSNNETALASSEGVRGGSIGNYCTIEQIRKRAGLQGNRWINDADLDVSRQAAQVEINSNLIGLYTIPFTTPINQMIRNITIDMAAGMALLGDYGPTVVLDTTNGQKKLDDARALLARIKDKELILPNTIGASTAISGANSINAWPDQTTGTIPTDPNNGAPRMFSTQDRY